MITGRASLRPFRAWRYDCLRKCRCATAVAGTPPPVSVICGPRCVRRRSAWFPVDAAINPNPDAGGKLDLDQSRRWLRRRQRHLASSRLPPRHRRSLWRSVGNLDPSERGRGGPRSTQGAVQSQAAPRVDLARADRVMISRPRHRSAGAERLLEDRQLLVRRPRTAARHPRDHLHPTAVTTPTIGRRTTRISVNLVGHARLRSGDIETARSGLFAQGGRQTALTSSGADGPALPCCPLSALRLRSLQGFSDF